MSTVPKCEIVSFMMPDGPPHYGAGATRAVYKCVTHNMAVPFGGEGVLCPIGRVEQAVDDGLEKIRAALAETNKDVR